mgnify:CR=1 FL=1|tara:strand:- start:771 stop:1625 length:855 start_codon:yes stop_codon:yes gene_type:complete
MKKSQKSPKSFLCEICDYNTCSAKDYNKHISTRKHHFRTFLNKKSPKIPEFLCDCGKTYTARNSLWYHKKKCELYQNNDETKMDATLVRELLQQNKELQCQIITMATQKNDFITHNTQNNQFNVNVFLNEHCKNAINFAEFIDRIQVTHDDLENNAQLGFVNGISQILINNLKQLTIHERPIHCTDVKRETMYIRENNEWHKDEDNEKINSAIQEVSRKSLKSLIDWKHKNPDYQNLDSEFSNKCIAMHQQSIAGEKTSVYYPKVIHNLARESAINKKLLNLPI